MANIYRAVKDADGRDIGHIVKDENAADPQFITDLLAANTGSSVQTLTEAQGATLEIGRHIASDGTVSDPTTESTPELLEARRNKIGEWVIAQGGSQGFLHYARFQSNPRARRYEAIQRMVYLRTHSESALQDAGWWAKMDSFTSIGWRHFVFNVNHAADGWDDTGVFNGLLNGSQWRLVSVNSGTGRYVLEADPAGSPPYTFAATHLEEYWDLLASAKTL